MTIRKQIVQRIQSYDQDNKQLFVEVAGSAQLDSVLKNRNATEGCYVIKLETQTQTQSEYYQKATERYQVITICRNFSDSYGSDVGEKAEDMQRTVFKAISGYVCQNDDNATNPLMFITGGLVDLKNNQHVWSDIYELSYTQKINQQGS